MNRCPYCNTSYSEILQTGFVGCSRCYSEIESLVEQIQHLHNGKVYKGRKPKSGNV
ncbi:MAG: hypothetical protein IJX25_04590 [Clostridia bacterium]|nr:hypothetical protein [Clostridia bacterium]